MEGKCRCSRLVPHEIYFLLLLPLEKTGNGRAPASCGFPCDLRIGIAGLIFPQTLDLTPVPRPGCLLRCHKHAINRAAQNLLSPRPQIRVDPQTLGHVKPSPETPDVEARLPLD